MFIMDTLRSVVGMINVKQYGEGSESYIRVSGLQGHFMAKDMNRLYRTSRVAKYMFSNKGSNFVEFPSFFALEFMRHLELSLEMKGYTYISKRTTLQVIEAMKEGTWVGKINEEPPVSRFNYKRLNDFLYQPLVFQRTWLEKFENLTYQMSLRGAILDAAAGSGKTYMGLYVAELSEADIVFVVTTNNAIEEVWTKTLREHLKSRPTYWTSKDGVPYNGQKYVICALEGNGLSQALHVASKAKYKKPCIILDESHYLNEIKSQRTQQAIELCKVTNSDLIVLQSGTTFKAIGSEIVPAMYMLDPSFNDDVAMRCKKMFSESANEALQLLSYRLGLISHRVEKHELGLETPELLTVKVPLPNGNDFTLDTVAANMAKFTQERMAYYKARSAEDTQEYLRIVTMFRENLVDEEDIVAYEKYMDGVKRIRQFMAREVPDELVYCNTYERNVILPTLLKSDADSFKEVKTLYKYTHLKVQGECLGRVLGRARLECAVAIASAVDYSVYIEETTKKTLVYTVYVEALEKAVEALKEKGYNPVAVYAKTNASLPQIVSKYDNDPSVNPLVATYKSLSTAVPLPMADMMIMLDVPFRDYILNQTISRINRLGATTKARVRICEADTGKSPNLSTRTVDILKWSQQQLKLLGFESPYPITEAELATEAFDIENPFANLIDYDLEAAFMRKFV